VPVHVSHLKGADEREADELLSYIDRVAVHEVDFSFDVYPYLPGSSMLNSLLPYEVWEEGPLAASAKLALPGVRRRFAAQLADYRLPLERIAIAWVASKENSRHQGRTLADYCGAVGKPPAEALADLLIEENLSVLCVFQAGDDRLAEPFVAHPRAMIGSDAIWQPEAPVHPRQYGTAPRVLGPLVRERGLLTLEEAVRKLSGFPAERLQLANRGIVRGGAFADLVVFDPLTVADRATFAEPCQPPLGVERVYVNGRAVLVDGQPVLASSPQLPGRVLRPETSAGVV
jgi:N-acyl-D-amino-acid deacylase